MSERDGFELEVCRGLVYRPSRLTDLAGFEPGWFQLPECRLLFNLAKAYQLRSVSEGKIRFAPGVALLRDGEAWVKRAKDKEVYKSRDSSFRALSSFVGETQAAPGADDDHVFRDAADRVRQAAQDDLANKSILDLARHLKGSGSAAGIATRLQEAAADISRVGAGVGQIGTLSEEAMLVFESHERAVSDPKTGYIPTPFERINIVSGGGKPGRLWLCAGYAKDGKTNLAVAHFYHAAVNCEKGVLAVTGEQTKDDIRAMLVCRHSHGFIEGGVSMRMVEEGRLSEDQRKALWRAGKDLFGNKKYGPISYVKASGGTTTTDICLMVEATGRRHPVDILAVDHTDLFESAKPQRTERERLACVIREIKTASLDLNGGKGAWVLACHQISREGREKGLKCGYYMPGDLAGSSEAERSADVVVWCFRDEDMKEMREVRIGVALDRRGPGEPRGFACFERYDAAAILPIAER